MYFKRGAESQQGCASRLMMQICTPHNGWPKRNIYIEITTSFKISSVKYTNPCNARGDIDAEPLRLVCARLLITVWRLDKGNHCVSNLRPIDPVPLSTVDFCLSTHCFGSLGRRWHRIHFQNVDQNHEFRKPRRRHLPFCPLTRSKFTAYK